MGETCGVSSPSARCNSGPQRQPPRAKVQEREAEVPRDDGVGDAGPARGPRELHCERAALPVVREPDEVVEGAGLADEEHQVRHDSGLGQGAEAHMAPHPDGGLHDLLGAVERRAGAEDLLPVHEEIHELLFALGGELPEPEAHQATGAAARVRRDGDALALAGTLERLAHGDLPLRRRGALGNRPGVRHGDRFRVEPQLLLQPVRELMRGQGR